MFKLCRNNEIIRFPFKYEIVDDFFRTGRLLFFHTQESIFSLKSKKLCRRALFVKICRNELAKFGAKNIFREDILNYDYAIIKNIFECY